MHSSLCNVFLSLGTNQGDKERNLCAAIEMIEKQIGQITAQSAFYTTEPWGFKSYNMFLNACIEVETSLSPKQLLRTTQHIELSLGRKQKSHGQHYADRIIDIDILLYDNVQLSTQSLTIPHPHLVHRRFVLQPLADIAPATVVPGTGKTVAELLENLIQTECGQSLQAM